MWEYTYCILQSKSYKQRNITGKSPKSPKALHGLGSAAGDLSPAAFGTDRLGKDLEAKSAEVCGKWLRCLMVIVVVCVLFFVQYVYTYIYIYLYIYLYTYILVVIYLDMIIFIYIYIYICLYIYIYVCMPFLKDCLT